LRIFLFRILALIITLTLILVLILNIIHVHINMPLFLFLFLVFINPRRDSLTKRLRFNPLRSRTGINIHSIFTLGITTNVNAPILILPTTFKVIIFFLSFLQLLSPTDLSLQHRIRT
jgi:hypothetical protein